MNAACDSSQSARERRLFEEIAQLRSERQRLMRALATCRRTAAALQAELDNLKEQ